MLKSLISGTDVFPSDSISPIKEKTICISGHREKSIQPYLDNPEFSLVTVNAVKLMLYRYIDMACESGYEYFLSGLATGADLWSAEYIIKKKRAGSNIKLIGVMPFIRHSEFYSANTKRYLIEIEKNADYLITTCSDENAFYKKGSPLYKNRNYYMVDKSSAIIAFLNSSHSNSGTSQTVNYAYREGKKIYKFGTEDVYKIMDKAGTDIKSIGKETALIKNVFNSLH